MIVLEAQKRDPKGANNEKIRKEGKLPAVFYGGKEQSTPIMVDTAQFKKALKEAGESTVMTLNVEGKNVDVLIHEVSDDPVSDEPIHADFYAIDKDKKVTVSIPLEFSGEAPAEKNLGGVIVKVLHELEVEGLPGNLPHEIQVNLGTLEDFDSLIVVKDLKLPEGVEATAEPDDVVVSVAEQKEEEEEAPAEVDLDSIEVEQKGKQEEEGEGAPASSEEEKGGGGGEEK